VAAVEVFLHAWWPSWREVRVYDYILRMEMAIQTGGSHAAG